MLFRDLHLLLNERSNAILRHTTKHHPLATITEDLERYDAALEKIKRELKASPDLLDAIYYDRYISGMTVCKISRAHSMSEATVYRYLQTIRKNLI